MGQAVFYLGELGRGGGVDRCLPHAAGTCAQCVTRGTGPISLAALLVTGRGHSPGAASRGPLRPGRARAAGGGFLVAGGVPVTESPGCMRVAYVNESVALQELQPAPLDKWKLRGSLDEKAVCLGILLIRFWGGQWGLRGPEPTTKKEFLKMNLVQKGDFTNAQGQDPRAGRAALGP